MLINNDTIIKDDNELVRQKSQEVTFPMSQEEKDLLLSMLKYVDDSTDEEIAIRDNLRPAVGISAIQVGVPKKMTAIVIKDENNNKVHEYALVNPRIVSESTEKAYLTTGEGCLSVEDEHQGYIYRAKRVKVRGYDLLQDKMIEIKAEDYFAIVLQHELDHFKGILFYDRINKDDPFIKLDDAVEIE